MTTPRVQYAYADGSANTIRPTQMTSPNGRQLNLSYGSSGSQGDLLSRLASLIDNNGTLHLADYTYLGLNSSIEIGETEPDLKYTLIGTAGGNDPDTGNIYRGLDRFGRVKDCYWRDYGNSSDAARIQYGYDRVSNRTYRADPVAIARSANIEGLYAYDGLQRLVKLDRGQLNVGHTADGDAKLSDFWTITSPRVRMYKLIMKFM